MTALPVRTTRARLDAFTESLADEPSPRPILSDAGRRAAEVEARRSLARTRAARVGALASACRVHHAEPGVLCWRDPRSGVRGICGARYGRGSAAASGSTGDRAAVRHPNRSGYTSRHSERVA